MRAVIYTCTKCSNTEEELYLNDEEKKEMITCDSCGGQMIAPYHMNISHSSRFYFCDPKGGSSEG